MTLIECRAVGRAYGTGPRRRAAVEDCWFTAERGEIIGVVGPNGAGKTTLLRLLAGEIAPTTGVVLVGGYPAGTPQARRLVGLAEDPPLAPPELTGREWLSYLASHRAGSPARRVALVRWAIEFGALAEFASRQIAEYPRGVAQRLGLAAAGLLAGGVLALDEVLSGVDPIVARGLRAAIAAFAASERLVVLTSHDLGTLERLATRVLVLSRGRVVSDVSTATLLKERVAELSLNGGAMGRIEWLMTRYSGASRTGDGIAIPLLRGLTLEEVLATCRAERIPVAATRVRYRALEDLLV